MNESTHGWHMNTNNAIALVGAARQEGAGRQQSWHQNLDGDNGLRPRPVGMRAKRVTMAPLSTTRCASGQSANRNEIAANRKQ